MLFVSLAVALPVAVAVAVFAIPRGDDLSRWYHFAKWKAIILKGIVDVDGPEPRLSLSREEDAAAWRHLLDLKDAEGYGFLMQRVLEGGETDAIGASIALASFHGNLDDSRKPISALVSAHEHVLRKRAEGTRSTFLRRVISDLYTHCKDHEPPVRDVKRTTPKAARTPETKAN